MRSRRRLVNLTISAVILSLVVLTGSTKGANWKYKPRYDGNLKIEGTINCDPVGDPLYEGHVEANRSYRGALPEGINDYQIDFTADPPGCENRNKQFKVGIWRWDPEHDLWELLEMAAWLRAHADELGLGVPVLADMRIDGEREITTMVDLSQVSGGIIFDGYDVVDGRCEDLPGFMFGTTAIVFNPNAGPDESPFSTTPYTGRVSVVGDLTLSRVKVPAVSQWGLIVMAVLVVAAGAMVIVRRRRCLVA